QHHVRHERRLGHELLMDTDEQIVPREPLLDPVLVGRHRHRIGVLNDERADGATALQNFAFAGQDCTNAGLIEHPYSAIPNVEPLNQRLVEAKNVGTDVKRTAAFVLPGTRHRRDTASGVHVSGAVALARKTIAEPEEGALVLADEPRERLDCLDGRSGYG